MNIALWVLQGLLGLAFVVAGGAKLTQPKSKLVSQPGMAWTNDFGETQIKLIGLAEALGALGVIVPAATGIVPVLTPVAAVGLALLMGGAIATHVRRKEQFAPAAVFAVLALVLAAGRFVA